MIDSSSIHIAIIYGSYRSDRKGINAARWVEKQLSARCKATLIDAQAYQLPMLDRMYKEYKPGEAPQAMQTLSTLLEQADGFVIVAGEYNHSIQPGLKNLMDHFQREYFFKPAAIASYSAGSFGGVRSAVHLRAMLGELGMVSTSTMLPIPQVSKQINEEGEALDDKMNKRFKQFADELLWYAEALKPARNRGLPF
jgi:NAD(P)H-dependent FMN reductase